MLACSCLLAAPSALAGITSISGLTMVTQIRATDGVKQHLVETGGVVADGKQLRAAKGHFLATDGQGYVVVGTGATPDLSAALTVLWVEGKTVTHLACDCGTRACGYALGAKDAVVCGSGGAAPTSAPLVGTLVLP